MSILKHYNPYRLGMPIDLSPKSLKLLTGKDKQRQHYKLHFYPMNRWGVGYWNK